MFLQVNEKINVFCIDHYFHHEQLNCKKYMLVCSNDIFQGLFMNEYSQQILQCLWKMPNNSRKKNAIILYIYFFYNDKFQNKFVA